MKDDIHTKAPDDRSVHTTRRDCWCAPTLEYDADYAAVLVIHHSEDGRERVEQQGMQ